MEEAFEMQDYLPVSFKTTEESEYVAFLWASFQANFNLGKFQFAFLAFHMLFMSHVYFKIWQIKHARPEDFRRALIGFSNEDERNILNTTSPFAFSRFQERRVFRFLKLVGCDNSTIGNYAKLVDDRNKMAHPNGHIFVKTQVLLEAKIRNVLRAVDDIQGYSKPIVESCYRDFLLCNFDPETREYSDETDQIREVLIRNNYMSMKDIGICTTFNVGELADRCGFEYMNGLHNCLHADYEENGLEAG